MKKINSQLISLSSGGGRRNLLGSGSFCASRINKSLLVWILVVTLLNFGPFSFNLSTHAADSPCAWTAKYDADYHWEECTVHKTAGTYDNTVHTTGGVKGNKTPHSKSSVSMVGCHWSLPAPVQSCNANCGWSRVATEYKQPHTNISGWLQHGHGVHLKICGVCSTAVEAVTCKTASGVNLNACFTAAGTCVTCGHAKTDTGHYGNFEIKNANEIACNLCQVTVGTYTGDSSASYNGMSIWDFSVTLNSHQIGSVWDLGSCTAFSGAIGNTTNLVYSNGNRTLSGRKTLNIKSTEPQNGDNHIWMNVVGITYNMHIGGNARYDWTTPSYVSHSISPPISDNTWAIQRDITVVFDDSGAINDYLEIGLFNATGSQLVAYGVAANNNGRFTRTFRLVVDAPASGANFILRARDRHNQVGEKIISLRYTDAVAPSSPSISGYNTTWAKSKTLRYQVTDLGSGGVQMALDNGAYSAATQSGNNYYKDFVFNTTISSPTNRVFYAKDVLGNLTAYNFTVGYVDVTVPSLTLSQSPDTTGSVWYKGDCIITVIMTDNDSGLSSLVVPAGCTPVGNVSLAGAKNSTKTFVVKQPGTYSFTITDVAGNTTTKTITIVKLDNSNPSMNAA